MSKEIYFLTELVPLRSSSGINFKIVKNTSGKATEFTIATSIPLLTGKTLQILWLKEPLDVIQVLHENSKIKQTSHRASIHFERYELLCS